MEVHRWEGVGDTTAMVEAAAAREVPPTQLGQRKCAGGEDRTSYDNRTQQVDVSPQILHRDGWLAYPVPECSERFAG